MAVIVVVVDEEVIQIDPLGPAAVIPLPMPVRPPPHLVVEVHLLEPPRVRRGAVLRRVSRIVVTAPRHRPRPVADAQQSIHPARRERHAAHGTPEQGRGESDARRVGEQRDIPTAIRILEERRECAHPSDVIPRERLARSPRPATRVSRRRYDAQQGVVRGIDLGKVRESFVVRRQQVPVGGVGFRQPVLDLQGHTEQVGRRCRRLDGPEVGRDEYRVDAAVAAAPSCLAARSAPVVAVPRRRLRRCCCCCCDFSKERRRLPRLAVAQRRQRRVGHQRAVTGGPIQPGWVAGRRVDACAWVWYIDTRNDVKKCAEQRAS